MPLISIIVSVYNKEKYLSKCLNSILSQKYKDFEIVLVDDGSTDLSGDICDEYADRNDCIRVIHKSNGGLISARKTGIKAAEGAYISFIDGDDWIEPDFYSDLLKKGTDERLADIYIGTYVSETEKGDVKKYFEVSEEQLLTSEEALEEMFKGRIFNWSLCDKLYKKDLFSDTDFWTSDNSYGEDTVANWALFRRAKKIFYKPDAKYHYVIHDDSMMNTDFSVKKLIYIDIYDKILNEIKGNDLLGIYVNNLMWQIAESIMYQLLEDKKDYQEEFIKYQNILMRYSNNEIEIVNRRIISKLIFMPYGEAKRYIQESQEKIISECAILCKKYDELYIYGAGNIASDIIPKLIYNGIRISGVIVTDNTQNLSEFLGIRLYEYRDLISADKNIVFALALNRKNSAEVVKMLDNAQECNYFDLGKNSVWYD